MTFRLGLTGAIGMGKSTTARMFEQEGCAVWDADAAVHRMYEPKGSAAIALTEIFPYAIEQGRVSREKLKEIIAQDPTALAVIEKVVHPLVAADRAEFFDRAKQDIVVFDIPLLFETGSDTTMDAVACVTVSPEVQEIRVMERGTMTREQFRQILAKQMPNSEKIARSDYVIETDTLDGARAKVQEIVAAIRREQAHA